MEQLGRIDEILAQYGVDHLHYIAPMANIPSILARGILSYNSVEKMEHINYAPWDVQKRREEEIPGFGKQIHDYVPLYFATHTPMQRVLTRKTKKGLPPLTQEELVFVEVKIDVFKIEGVVFSDGNAASSETKFYTEFEDFSKLDWKIIHNPKCYSRNYKRKKTAEVLIPDNVPIQYFRGIIVHSLETMETLIKKTKEYAKTLKTADTKKTADTRMETLIKKAKEYMKPLKTADTEIDWSYMPKCKYSVDPSHYYDEWDNMTQWLDI